MVSDQRRSLKRQGAKSAKGREGESVFLVLDLGGLGGLALKYFFDRDSKRRGAKVANGHGGLLTFRYGKISSGEENQQRQENGDEMMQIGGQNYQRRD